MIGSELEFFLLKETYEEAHTQGYENLTPSVPYILDYHILASTYDEGFIRQIRNGMQAAGMKVETSKGEAWPGQHEINFRYADALTMADNHVVYKNGAKELAHLNGCSITFMAKPDHSWIGVVLPHPLVALARRRERVRRRDAGVRGLAGGADREPEGARDLPRAERQLVQALRGGLVGADDARLGARQPDVRLPDRRARAGAADGDPDPRRRREPVSRVRRDHRRRARRDRARARAAAGARGQRLRVGRRPLPALAARGDRRARGRHDRARRVRRRGDRPLPQLRAHRAGALRPRGHLVRAAAVLRAWLGP